MHSFKKKQEASWCCFALLVNGNSGKPEIQLPRQQRQRRHQDPLVNANTTQPNKQTNKQGDKDKDEQSDQSALVKKYEEKSAVQSIKHDLARSCFKFWLKIGDEGDKISKKNWRGASRDSFFLEILSPSSPILGQN